jgi:hypothetical protein
MCPIYVVNVVGQLFLFVTVLFDTILRETTDRHAKNYYHTIVDIFLKRTRSMALAHKRNATDYVTEIQRIEDEEKKLADEVKVK